MREKLATLPLAELRELAKAQGIKGVAGLRKSELIDRLCEIAQELSLIHISAKYRAQFPQIRTWEGVFIDEVV